MSIVLFVIVLGVVVVILEFVVVVLVVMYMFRWLCCPCLSDACCVWVRSLWSPVNCKFYIFCLNLLLLLGWLACSTSLWQWCSLDSGDHHHTNDTWDSFGMFLGRVQNAGIVGHLGLIFWFHSIYGSSILCGFCRFVWMSIISLFSVFLVILFVFVTSKLLLSSSFHCIGLQLLRDTFDDHAYLWFINYLFAIIFLISLSVSRVFFYCFCCCFSCLLGLVLFLSLYSCFVFSGIPYCCFTGLFQDLHFFFPFFFG